jgi:hypothetical protein
MQPDPSYLDHLGELATLKNFLGCYYHQDAWEDFHTDAEIWAAYRKEASPEELARIVEQLQTLLARSDDEVHAFFRANVDGRYFVDPPDTRGWLQRLLEYFQRPDDSRAT